MFLKFVILHLIYDKQPGLVPPCSSNSTRNGERDPPARRVRVRSSLSTSQFAYVNRNCGIARTFGTVRTTHGFSQFSTALARRQHPHGRRSDGRRCLGEETAMPEACIEPLASAMVTMNHLVPTNFPASSFEISDGVGV